MESRCLVTAESISRALNMSKAAVDRLARQNKIPAYRFGKKFRFDLEEVLNAGNDASRSIG